MAGTFTRSIFYKLDTSPNATVQYIGVNRTPSPYVYRLSNSPAGGTIYQGGGIAYSPSTSPTNRVASPTGGSILSPAWPRVAGNTTLIYVQEGSPTSGAGTYSYSAATSSATIAAINIPVVSSTQSYSSQSPSATILHSPAFTTIGAGGTLEVNKTSPTITTYPTTGWTSTSAFTVDRGAQYNIWARRGVGVLNEGQYADYTLVSTTVPYLGVNAEIRSPRLDGIPTSATPYGISPATTSVAVTWGGTVSPGYYRIVRLSPGPTTLLVGSSQGRTSGTITDLPTSPGEVWKYSIQVRRVVADGGNGDNADCYVSPTQGVNPFFIKASPNSVTSTTLTVGTIRLDSVSTNFKELTGNYSPNVSVGWSPVASHTYRIVRTDTGSEIPVTTESASQPQTLIYSPAGDLPEPGELAEYYLQVRRPTANGGDNLWYDATGTNQPFSIQRIGAPTVDDSQAFTSNSPTVITHTIELKADGVGGTLQYGWNTGGGSPGTVSNWQTSAKFNNAFTRGSTYYFYARRSTDRGDYDVSTAQVIPQATTYGLRVFSTNGSKVILDINSLPLNNITCKDGVGAEITSQTLAAGATGAPVYVDGLTSSNGASVFVIITGAGVSAGSPPYTLTRNAGNFTLKNNTTASSTLGFFAGRYK